jgi:aspartate ammonia-lyase
MVKVTGAFQKSTEIMKTTNQLVKLPQLSATMREMSMEMMKVGEEGRLIASTCLSRLLGVMSRRAIDLVVMLGSPS